MSRIRFPRLWKLSVLTKKYEGEHLPELVE